MMNILSEIVDLVVYLLGKAKEGRVVDALALGDDEGRGKLR